MKDFDSTALLTIDDTSLSLGTVLRYYQLSGRLLPWIRDIVEQHIIFSEVQRRDDLNVTLAEVEQAAVEVRVQQKLTDATIFQQWLDSQGMNYELFQNRIILNLKLEKLKSKIAAPNLQALFDEQKSLLDQVEVTCVVFAEEAHAGRFKGQVLKSQDFDRVVSEYTIADPLKVSVMKSGIRFGQLPEDVRGSLQTATVGELVGPVNMEQRWCVFRIEQFSPATLEGAVQKSLEDRLFQQWLIDRAQAINVKLGASTEPSANSVLTAV
ncbi:peptidyl-prolyl cis-trans isomerase [Leptolyngbya sp. NIES-2104]|uniref:peptidylprolyl isomerase n=1 Tax=Leptolyngbya sp. NIES-2104 TaxID=1552121 RepID=UPI0006ECB282|nr:peptidylprolyl isomerase [Leptolyngbya sp. NIES-2104]GAP96046.1 parvulin-like peptidyl-prolyl isomerase [Leptolyngbya sp. NIES-2104]